MKKIIILLIFILGSLSLIAQDTECGTRAGNIPYMFSKQKQDSINTILAINSPYCVRVYINVFADDNGTNRADTDANILTNFQYMVNSFQSHNICFMLINIKQINNTDLNSHSVSEESELLPYLQTGCLTMFVHNSLSGYNGNAYAIPNTYLSLNGSSYNIATMGHETGHCLGLYHTFQKFGNPAVQENVTRNSGNNCYNCNTEGDLLCDTPADVNDDGVNSSCIYVGGGTDPCSGTTYAPLTNNMMTYGYFTCRTTFTNGQGNRMRSTIIGNAAINDLIADDIVYRPSSSNSSITWNTSEGFETARDALYISNFTNDAYNVTGSAVRRFVSKKVYLKPGTHFYPTTGKVQIKANPYCN